MKRVVISGMVGNGLEWYDFALYGQFAPILAKLFFPTGDPFTSLLATYGTFAAGFAMRPLGAILFGWIGDRHGRKAALSLAILMMAVPTALIGLLPTYAQIGIWAPILLTTIRLLQGLSLGGEFSGSIAFIIEHSKDGKRGLAGSASMGSLVAGMLLGSTVAMLVSDLLSAEDLVRWGWRIPFICGLAIGFVGFFIRHGTEESPKYLEARDAGHLSETPLGDSFRFHGKALWQSVAIYLTVTVPFYLLNVFMITFLTTVLHRPMRESLTISTLALVMLLFGIMRGAALSDKIGRKPVLVAGALGMLVFAWPFFWLLTSESFLVIAASVTVFALMLGAYMGPVPAAMVELFPTAVRNTGMAVSYNIAAALFGGTAPFVATGIIKLSGHLTSVAFYIMLCAVITLVTLRGFKDRYREPLS